MTNGREKLWGASWVGICLAFGAQRHFLCWGLCLALGWLRCPVTRMEPKWAPFAATLEPFVAPLKRGSDHALPVDTLRRSRSCVRVQRVRAGQAMGWSWLEKGLGRVPAVGLCVLSRGKEALPTRVLDLRPLLNDADPQRVGEGELGLPALH